MMDCMSPLVGAQPGTEKSPQWMKMPSLASWNQSGIWCCDNDIYPSMFHVATTRTLSTGWRPTAVSSERTTPRNPAASTS